MKYLFTLLALITFLGTGVRAQKMLTGRVTDAATQEPVGFATVYLDGTSIGDVTNDDGRFQLRIPEGMEQSTLIISHLNYQAFAQALTAADSELALDLLPKAAQLTRIEVDGEDRREENIKEFRRALLGRDAWGRNVEIMNEEVIRFTRDGGRKTIRNLDPASAEILRRRQLRDAEWSADGSSVTYSAPTNLRAATDGALHLMLPDLGYELHIDLAMFKNDYQSRQMSYLGSNFFAPITGVSAKMQRRFARNRLKAYYGSQMHFLRSLIDNTLEENGFQVVEVLQEPSATRQQEIRKVNLRDYLHKQKDGNYLLTGLGENRYAILYYGKRLAPGTSPQLNAPANVLQSRMFLVGEAALILPSGVSGDVNLVFSGDIGDRKLAWTLPSDWQLPEGKDSKR